MKSLLRRICFSLLLVGLLISLGCSRSDKQTRTLRLGTTTSTRDSGLLDELVPLFEAKAGIVVKVIAVGSGQALELGRRGDVDVLLTHAPDAEQLFVADGHGREPQRVMHNDFVLVGPTTDPAGIKNEGSSIAALRQISNAQVLFVSRGDESGTHKKEQQLWNKLELMPQGEWYLQAGTGMAEVLRMADEKRAYTLTDRATYLAHRSQLSLEILVERDTLLRNQYSVIVVNPEKHPEINHDAARQFADFLLTPEVQQRIGTFGVKRFEQPLFFPNSDAPSPIE